MKSPLRQSIAPFAALAGVGSVDVSALGSGAVGGQDFAMIVLVGLMPGISGGLCIERGIERNNPF